MNFMFEWQEQYLTSERSEREYPLAIYYMAVSSKDWELPNSRIWVCTSWLKSRPEVFCGEKVAN